MSSAMSIWDPIKGKAIEFGDLLCREMLMLGVRLHISH